MLTGHIGRVAFDLARRPTWAVRGLGRAFLSISLYPSIHLSIHLSIYLSNYLFIHLSIHPSRPPIASIPSGPSAGVRARLQQCRAGPRWPQRPSNTAPRSTAPPSTARAATTRATRPSTARARRWRAAASTTPWRRRAPSCGSALRCGTETCSVGWTCDLIEWRCEQFPEPAISLDFRRYPLNTPLSSNLPRRYLWSRTPSWPCIVLAWSSRSPCWDAPRPCDLRPGRPWRGSRTLVCLEGSSRRRRPLRL